MHGEKGDASGKTEAAEVQKEDAKDLEKKEAESYLLRTTKAVLDGSFALAAPA